MTSQVTNKKLNNKSWFWLLISVIFMSITTVVVAYGIYLDRNISNRINGRVWQLSIPIYGRIMHLEPTMTINKNHVIKLLEAAQYRQVLNIQYPGDFVVQTNSIEVNRRPFDFPDNKEGQIHALLNFDNDRLLSIKNIDDGYQLSFLRLDPRLITVLSSSNGEQRLFVTRNHFPKLLVDTLLITEDRHFYEHDGVNIYSIGRALLANIIAGHTVQGASTLTQQLAKNLFLSGKRSYWRKINEAYIALLIESHYSKDRILELYMNEVYLGQIGDNEIRGFPLASLYYFNRPIGELSLDQQALLVGMVKGASIYNPWRNPDLALERRNLVLSLLQQQQVINHKLYNILSTRPLGVQLRSNITSPQPAFVQMVRQELQTKLGNRVTNFTGIKIFTTLDYIAQNAAEKAVINGIPILRKQRNLKDLETAMVIVDRCTGEIRAMIGSADPQYAGYNRAMQARRSIGSLAKPATYLTALSYPNKYRLNTWIPDMPISLRQANGEIWSPQNDDHHFRGQVMLVDALISSMNVPTVNLGIVLGLPAITDTWQKLGVPKNAICPVQAMILGALNLTPVEVAQAFQTIASGGNRAKLSVLRFVIDENGAVLYQNYPQAERVISAQAAYMIMWIMQQVMQYGTGYQLGMKYPNLHLAGKTGTTNNNIDTWFAGIDGREVVITWVGRDNNQSTAMYGSSGAMTIYQQYLENQSPAPLNLILPEDIITMNIDDMGHFVCGKIGIRSLPVWITGNQDIFCQEN